METEEITQRIEYTRTIVPRSMRSLYWKYFGFPSDNSNNILTKDKIICTLCHATVAYNKNTTNLRTHLMTRHPELFMEVQRKREIMSVCKLSEDFKKRPKIDNTQEKGIPIMTTISSSQLRKALSPTRYTEETEDQENDENQSRNEPEELEDYESSLNEDSFENIDESASKMLSNSFSIQEKILDMLISDLLPLSTIEGTGFQHLISTCTGTGTSIQKNMIESELFNIYNRDFKKLENHLKSISQTRPFSISVESYINVEKKTIVCIYVNYLSPQTNELICVLYRTIDDCAEFSDIFGILNLKNCSVVILNNGDLQDIESFLNLNDIPISICFESLINRILNAIFELPAVNLAYENIRNFFHEARSEESMPPVTVEYGSANPWSKYDFIEFVHDHVRTKNPALELTKEIIDFLKPFKITLETISEEPIPMCSLVRPVTVKLLEEHFSPYISQSDVISEARNIINDELSLSVLSNNFLNEATFFDPRFLQHEFVTTDFDASSIKKSISERFKFLLDDAETEEKSVKTEIVNTSRKTSLGLFFNRNNTNSVAFPTTRRDSLDKEISKYRNELPIDLSQCPVSWWKINACMYRKMEKMSNFYMSAPCCVNKLFKLSTLERNALNNKRYVLTKKLTVALWFLHYNKDFIDKLHKDSQSDSCDT